MSVNLDHAANRGPFIFYAHKEVDDVHLADVE
jgi:hypothetical protein